MFNENVTRSQNKAHLMHSASWSVSGLGICGCLFNAYVVLRIISQGVRRSHFSKIYYLSLAVADFAVAGSSVGFTFMFHDVIKIKKDTWLWFGANGIAWVSFTSSLLHVVAITADRFVATMFPFRYRTDVTHKRVAIAIASIWLISIALVISMTWHYSIAFWCGVIGVPIGSLGIIVTYTHIVIISVKRERSLRLGLYNSDAPIVSNDVANSINTICLGLSITLTYVICNLPFSVVLLMFLHHKSHPQMLAVVILHVLLTTNTVVDPMLYTLFDVIRNRMKKEAAKKAQRVKMISQRVTSGNADTCNLTSGVPANSSFDS